MFMSTDIAVQGRVHVRVSCPFVGGCDGGFNTINVSAMTTMTKKDVHQGASQQQQVHPVAGEMVPVFAQQVEGANYGDHQEGNPQGSTHHRLVAHGVFAASRSSNDLRSSYCASVTSPLASRRRSISKGVSCVLRR